VKILIGGSPCTKWSIAQKNNRETKPEGLGWELFENYLIAKEKFKPDYFLYENNKSAAQPIKDQISKELGVDLMYINSALVSAQNRQRFYAFNWEVDQPEDRGILLRDILETGVTDRDKSRCVTASVGRTTHREYFQKQQNTMAAEPVDLTGNDKAYALTTTYGNCVPHATLNRKRRSMIAEPIGVGWRGRKGADGKWHKQYESTGEEKANCLTTAQTDSMVAEPVNVTPDGKSQTIKAQYHKTSVANVCCYKSTYGATGVAEPVPCGQRQQDKSRTITAGYQTCSQRDLRMDIETDGFMGKQGVIEILPYYATAIEWDENGKPTKAVSGADGKVYTVYEVRDGIITIKDKQYPIKLPDGFYIIRKLTPVECERLQTLPDGYTRAVSDAQRYKGLGNGWTAEVIIHILNGILKDVPRDEEIVVLSMYDGIGTGRYCLDKMGFTNVKYYAYEIDKFAKQIAMSNYPDIIQCGDAFQVRDSEWHL
jgi:DNA (cytosine-5)-methyltransferase 3A